MQGFGVRLGRQGMGRNRDGLFCTCCFALWSLWGNVLEKDVWFGVPLGGAVSVGCGVLGRGFVGEKARTD